MTYYYDGIPSITMRKNYFLDSATTQNVNGLSKKSSIYEVIECSLTMFDELIDDLMTDGLIYYSSTSPEDQMQKISFDKKLLAQNIFMYVYINNLLTSTNDNTIPYNRYIEDDCFVQELFPKSCK